MVTLLSCDLGLRGLDPLAPVTLPSCNMRMRVVSNRAAMTANFLPGSRMADFCYLCYFCTCSSNPEAGGCLLGGIVETRRRLK